MVSDGFNRTTGSTLYETIDAYLLSMAGEQKSESHGWRAKRVVEQKLKLVLLNARRRVGRHQLLDVGRDGDPLGSRCAVSFCSEQAIRRTSTATTTGLRVHLPLQR